MAKKLLLFICIAMSGALFAQEVDRTKIKGKITAQKEDDLEGITIYNQSSQKGTVTNADGNFEIEVAENDRLYVTALQYQSFTVVVDKGIIDKLKMNIFMNPYVNQLDEVVVRPYDLSGNIRVDVKKIPTYNIGKDWDLSYKNLEYGYQFTPDGQSAITGNAAEEALHGNALKNGANILGILAGAVSLLLPKKERVAPAEKLQSGNDLNENLQQRFSKNFIADTFEIPEDKAVDFLYFVQESGLEKDLLKAENEMLLMEFLQKKSKEYKARSEE